MVFVVTRLVVLDNFCRNSSFEDCVVGHGWMEKTYSNLEVNDLVTDCAHFIVEAEAVFADVVGCKDKVALLFVHAV